MKNIVTAIVLIFDGILDGIRAYKNHREVNQII